MNCVSLSGFTTRTVVEGDGYLRFTVVAKHGYDKKKGEELKEFVPCCVFNPSEKIRAILSKDESLFLEFNGRISSSRYEKDGEMKYSTQVIVDAKSINLIK